MLLNRHTWTTSVRNQLTRPKAITWAVGSPGPMKFAWRAAQPDNATEMPERNPMGRMADTEADIGSIALFQASEDCRNLTCDTLFPDGGHYINGVRWMTRGRTQHVNDGVHGSTGVMRIGWQTDGIFLPFTGAAQPRRGSQEVPPIPYHQTWQMHTRVRGGCVKRELLVRAESQSSGLRTACPPRLSTWV